ncbi:hypothetical protein MHU86_19620 [Fragilaria crotonensis]|nr:hypothetical protein MHU86_19620 [Fragilaria crotonensis]
MAEAAREAEPHLPFPNKGIIDLVEGDVEVVVTVSKTINATLILDSVYQFDGTKELVGKLNHKQKRGVINAYLHAIFKPEDHENKVWHLRHILLRSQSVENVSFGTAPRIFYSSARRFYETIFHASVSMEEQIERAMKEDITLLILALRIGKQVAVPKSFSPYSQQFATVSAVSFQMHRDPIDAGNMSVFLSLLGVTHHSTNHPPSIQSWRRNGVGLFMLIQVIKRCASVDDVKKIEVFVQCSEPAAFHFYTMIGFRRMNKSETDDAGFGMLPDHLQTALRGQKPSPFKLPK